MRANALAILTLCFALASNAAENIRLRADLWMPFDGDPAGEKPGYAVEIVRKIFVPQGITIDFQIMPWGDALQAANAGEIEGVIGADRSEAARLVVPTESIGQYRVGIYALKTSPWKYENLGSLEKIRLGVQLDYKYWDALDAYISNHREPQVIRIGGDNPIEAALAKLKAGEIDALPETESVFAWAVSDAGYNGADFRTAFVHEGEGIFIAFASEGGRGARYARLFDLGMKALRQNGDLRKILARYGQTDWQK